ncbi:hypothetical protein EDEG_00696 [Edhazardia aedis USNM 41457]|uniref:Pre-rRNA-processing protein PNO1 n=1 Tax=Edhazardia aedis (strain USNM 41457) TaxID=1003232 RepID=J9DBX8_EDHAE|nr:hypothetical protein EDEG_00696 [Edhazardia aedis USNM 41457]|eukprot:EJW05231.1 hypothetical protein EDEG_00696 [Edhazardia aedis USNM 41457]
MNFENFMRSIEVPQNKIGYFKLHWHQIYMPLVELFDMQVRFNLHTKAVDIRSNSPKDLERCAHFIAAIVFGFSVEESLKILRNTDCFTFKFSIFEVKKLKNEHVSRAIGRIIGTKGRVKQAIEKASSSSIIINDTDIFILGNTESINLAKHAICKLIMGSDPGKVCNDIRNITGKILDKDGLIENIVYRIE